MSHADLHCAQKGFATAQQLAAEEYVVEIAVANLLRPDRVRAALISLTFAWNAYEILEGERCVHFSNASSVYLHALQAAVSLLGAVRACAGIERHSLSWLPNFEWLFVSHG